MTISISRQLRGKADPPPRPGREAFTLALLICTDYVHTGKAQLITAAI